MPIASSATPVERATAARFVFSAVRSRITWLRAAEAGLLLITLGLRPWGLDQNGFGIDYYSAAVRSMTQSWHNFLYNAFDPAGFLSVDKQPVALWIQAASAKLFGLRRIDPRTMTLDPERLQARLSTTAAGPRITAVIPVHLYGGPADMDPILEVAREHGLMVIEDAPQAHGVEYRGRRAGSLGQAGCFSFYPTKNLGACGDAGMVVTNDAGVAERLRMLRNYGEEAKYRSRTDGFNSRLDELQAAILRVKLRHLEEWIAERRRWARLYGELLADAPVTLPAEPPSCTTRHPCTCSPRMSRSAPTKAASPRPSARARRSVAAALSRALRSRGTAHRRGRPLGAVRPATTGRLAISEARAHPGPWARRLATNGSVSTSESFSS